jgi:hypothetical protein
MRLNLILHPHYLYQARPGRGSASKATEIGCGSGATAMGKESASKATEIGRSGATTDVDIGRII